MCVYIVNNKSCNSSKLYSSIQQYKINLTMTALTSCCKCFSLKTGSIIIGLLTMLSAIFAFIMAIIINNELARYSDLQGNKGNYIMLKAATASVIAYVIMVFTLALMLLFGTSNRKPHYVFPYLCLSFTGIIVSIATAIGSLSYVIIVTGMHPLILLIVFFISSGLAFKIYLWLVVYHFYKELLCEKFGRQINPATGKIFKEPFEQDV